MKQASTSCIYATRDNGNPCVLSSVDSAYLHVDWKKHADFNLAIRESVLHYRKINHYTYIGARYLNNTKWI